MKFVKYNDNKSVTIPPAVLTVCGLDDEGKLEMAGAKGAVILSKSEMTAMEMVRSGTGIVLGPKSFAEYYGVCAVPLSPPFEESLSFVCLRENKNRIGLKELRKYLLEIC